MPHPALARLRAICLSLPDSTEVEAWGAPTFRVGKIFAMYSDPSDHQHSGGRPGVWLKAAPGNQELMVRDRPERFFVPPYVGPSGWIGVWLDKRVSWKEVRQLVTDSYRLVAPKRSVAKLLVLLLCLVFAGTARVEAQATALVGVTVIDGSGEPARRDQTVLVRDSLISVVGPRDDVVIPRDATILRLDGHTVIPGIVGMHNHLHMPGNTFLGEEGARLYLAAGVTTIMTAGSAEATSELALADAIATGRVAGPRIVPSAPYVTGPGGNGPMDKPATPEAARAFVREWVGRGARWFKLYRHTEPHIARALITEAHAHGAKVTGHLCSITFAEAAAMGIDGIEHGLISATDIVADKPAGECVSNAAALAELNLDSDEVQALVETLVRRRVTLTSTLAIIESHFPHRPQGDARALQAMAAAWQAAYAERQQSLRANAARSRYTPELLMRLVTFERMFAAAGGRLLVGPDPGRHVLPGFGDQRNFELLVEFGYATETAIQMMTANGAVALGEADRFGLLERGMLADLVVLDGDLARDASAIRETRLVMSRGVRHDPERLRSGIIVGPR